PPTPAGTPEAVPAPADGRLPARYTNRFGMEFALVPAGTSWLGGRGGKVGDRGIEIAGDFYLGVYEVTQEEWARVMGPAADPSRFSRTGSKSDRVADVPDAELRRFPVNSASWDDAQRFVAQL